MGNSMTKKYIVLVLSVCFYNTVMSMELELSSEKNCIMRSLKTLSQDTHKEILSYIHVPQWWYLQHAFEHDNRVESVCFNFSSTQFATACDDNKARIFDVKTKKEEAVFKHDNCVRSVCFNPSGTQFATACDDKKARIFDVATKKEEAVFTHDNRVRSICFNSSGTQLATACSDKRARIFDVKTKKEEAVFEHDDCVFSVCFNPSGTQLATGSWDRKARIFDIKTKKEETVFEHDDWVRSVCFNPSGTQFAISCDDKKARIFARYDDYTVEQLMLKKALVTWLLIEKPNQYITTREALFADVAEKCDISVDGLVATWKTFPEDMQAAILRTMQHRITRYGKYPEDTQSLENNVAYNIYGKLTNMSCSI